MRSMIETLGYRVSRVCITQLVGDTYHSRVHLAPRLAPGGAQGAMLAAGGSASGEVEVDARPSGAGGQGSMQLMVPAACPLPHTSV